MRILGIDPGVAIVGFGVLDCAGARQQMVQYGAINTPAGMPLAARLTLIESDLTALIREFQALLTARAESAAKETAKK